MIVDHIKDYSQYKVLHHGGTLSDKALYKLEKLASGIQYSVETGCGKSSVLLSRISLFHEVFCIDDRNDEKSSLNYVLDCPHFSATSVKFNFGPTQRTLPRFDFKKKIDLALLDGPHGYPFPDLEYAFIYPHLKEGALLVIDDIHIPTVRRMFEIISEDAMFALEDIEMNTAFLRRTAAPILDPEGDGWWKQNYNKIRYPGYSF